PHGRTGRPSTRHGTRQRDQPRATSGRCDLPPLSLVVPPPAHQGPPIPRVVTRAWATFWLSIAVAGRDWRTMSRCSWLLTDWPSLARRMLWPMLPDRIHCSAAPWSWTSSSTPARLPSNWTVAEAAPALWLSVPWAVPPAR